MIGRKQRGQVNGLAEIRTLDGSPPCRPALPRSSQAGWFHPREVTVNADGAGSADFVALRLPPDFVAHLIRANCPQAPPSMRLVRSALVFSLPIPLEAFSYETALGVVSSRNGNPCLNSRLITVPA